jgi:Tfp pilus assembly protein PilN
MLEQTVKTKNYLKPQSHRSPILFVLLLSFLAGASYFLADLMERENDVANLNRKLERLSRTSNFPEKIKVSSKDLEFQKKWAQLSAERDFPWTRLFQAIERSSNKEIELLELAPDKNSRLIILRGEAKSVNALTDFLDRLSAQEGLSGVHLSHQELTQRERLETISFEIKAKLI